MQKPSINKQPTDTMSTADQSLYNPCIGFGADHKTAMEKVREAQAIEEEYGVLPAQPQQRRSLSNLEIISKPPP